ncbi:MAG: helix-turn-helix domain-containing protein [Bacteroidales bacterium]|nr:helix-turn-helix domain-containing protein [Bacteroidales bacterium]
MKTGKLIRELRILKDMARDELAELTGLSSRTIQRIEDGEKDPRTNELRMIAKALEVDFSILSEIEPNESKGADEDSEREWLALIHLSGMLPLFFPSVIIWNRKKDDIKEMTGHFRAVIAFQSTTLFMCLLGCWALYNAHNPRAIIGFLFLSILFSIKNTLNVLNGKPYKYFGLFRTKDKNNRVKVQTF